MNSRILNSRSGFTLIELVVVIFMLSLLMGIVMPSFYKLSEGRLRSEAGKIASLLRYMNDSAISRKETFPLRINLDTRTIYWNSPEGEKRERFETLLDVSATSTGNISKGEITLFFSPLGLQDNLILNLKDDDKKISVLFYSLSGRTKIKLK